MKNSLLLTLILSLCFTSCKNTGETDHSLSLKEYGELGMPDISKIWDINDYSMAFFVLNTLKYENPKALPTRESETSAVLFKRMISLENLSFLNDETLPLWARADRIKFFVNTLMELKGAYTLIGVEQQYYTRELMDIDIFRLSVLHKMLELGQLINESEDPSDVAMQADFPKIQQMYVNKIVALLEEQQNSSMYSSTSLELLSDSISVSVKGNMGWFNETASESIEEAMRSVMDHTTSRKIKSDYREVAKLLENS